MLEYYNIKPLGSPESTVLLNLAKDVLDVYYDYVL